MIIPKELVRRKFRSTIPAKADAQPKKHKSIDDSLLMREAKNEILYGDIDVKGLNQFLQACIEGDKKVH